MPNLEETELGKAFIMAHDRMLAPGRDLEVDTLRMVFADFECPEMHGLTDLRVQVAIEALAENGEFDDPQEAVLHAHRVLSGLFLEALLTGLLLQRSRSRHDPFSDS